jgi:hypothetical protein
MNASVMHAFSEIDTSSPAHAAAAYPHLPIMALENVWGQQLLPGTAD